VILGFEILSIIINLLARNKTIKKVKFIVDILGVVSFVIVSIVIPIFSLNSVIYLVVMIMNVLTSLLNLNN
jgi:hypothetical protein